MDSDILQKYHVFIFDTCEFDMLSMPFNPKPSLYVSENVFFFLPRKPMLLMLILLIGGVFSLVSPSGSDHINSLIDQTRVDLAWLAFS